MVNVSAEKFFLWMHNHLKNKNDAESFYLLLDLVGGISKKDINFFRINRNLSIKLKENLYSLTKKWDDHISTHKPIQYICKYSYWRRFKFKVNNKVLIPRSETELIIDLVEGIKFNDKKKLNFVDLGTGSGAIAITLADANPSWTGHATDIDKNAIQIAKSNHEMISSGSNLNFYEGNWWEPLEEFRGKIDLAIANPPYIPEDIYEDLPLEVKNFEPKIALCGGVDGLIHLHKIIKEAPKYLSKNGWLIVENHFNHGFEVKRIFNENGFDKVEVKNDLKGIGRFTIGKCN